MKSPVGDNGRHDKETATLTGVGVTHNVAESKRHVQDLLASGYRESIVSMIQRFEGVSWELLAAMLDELMAGRIRVNGII